MRGETLKEKKVRGFTLVELLIAMAILMLFFSVLVLAVNPFEQINKAKDVAAVASAKDFVSTINGYLTFKKKQPWEVDTVCKDELSKETTIAQMKSCVKELLQNTKLEEKYVNSEEAKELYVTECAGAIAACYNPKSKKFESDLEAKYTKNGVIQPGCPGGDDCYLCTFSTPEAQECFQALNPNGSLAIVPSPSPKAPLPIQNKHSKNSCSNPSLSTAACMTKIVTNSFGDPLSSLGLPAGMGPEQIHSAYNLPCTPGGAVASVCNTPSAFGPKTIAIVVAYHSPTLEKDLAVYNNAFGLPPCTIANGCLTVVNQNGTTSPLPATDANWALEEAIDVQMAHAVCQTCKILVVEANSNYFTDLIQAVNRAAQMGAHAISNSYGTYDSAGVLQYDSGYNHPGIFVTAASGDSGYQTNFPASSRHVVAVGGTTLSLLSDYTYLSESVWGGTGSGCSSFQSAQSFQTTASNWNLTGCGTKRGIVDVSAVSDPSTGVAIYNSTSLGGRTGWWIVGGTSVASPIVASALAMYTDAPSGVPAASYLYQNPSKFRDITQGSNGSCGGTTACKAGVGYDGPTGLGTPNFLGGTTVSSTPSPTASPSATPTLIATPSPTLIPTVSPNLGQAWIATYWYIYRFQYNGLQIGDYLTLQTNFASYGLAVVGNEIWTGNALRGSISRLNFDGTKTKPDITGNGLNTPQRLAVVGNEVWVLNTSGYNSPNTISRFNFDGTPAGSVLSGNGLCFPSYLSVVGNEVWVTNYNFYGPCSYFIPNSTISRFKFDGTSAGDVLTGNNLDHPTFIAVFGQEVWVGNDNYSNTYKISRFKFDGTSAGDPYGYPPINNVNTPYDMVVIPSSGSGVSPTPTAIPTSTATPTPTPTPVLNCSTDQIVSLTPANTVTIIPGQSANYTLKVDSNDSVGCSSLYTISYGHPSGWTVSGLPPSFTLSGGSSKSITITVSVPSSYPAGTSTIQIWVAKQGQSIVNPVNGTIQVMQVGPTNTPTPTPFSCFYGWSSSLASDVVSGRPGDVVNQTLRVTYLNPPACGSALFVFSYSTPAGIGEYMPPSVRINGGETANVPITIYVGNVAPGDYLLQYWVFGGLPINGTLRVLPP